MDVDLPALLAALDRLSRAIGNPDIAERVGIGNPSISDNPFAIGNPNMIGNPNLYWTRPVRIWPWLSPPPPPPPPMAMIGGFDPQPDPPGRRLLLASATVAQQIATSAVAAEASGVEGGAARVVSRAVEDWCGTKPPHLPIPWPSQWPFPWAIDYPGPDGLYPGPDNLYPGPDGVRTFEADARTVGALTLASVASRVPEGDVRKALTKGSEKLLKTALSG
jgi:hypothetical protein